jgi:hypothetical protein
LVAIQVDIWSAGLVDALFGIAAPLAAPDILAQRIFVVHVVALGIISP